MAEEPSPGSSRLLPEVAASTLALGLAAGALWAWLAPAVQARVVAGQNGAGLELVLDADQAAWLFPRQGVLALLLLACGVLQAAVLLPRHRAAGAAVPPLLAVAGLVGAVVAWRTGVLLGPAAIEGLDGLAVGDRVEAPLRVDAWGVLLVWAVAALAVVLLLNAWVEDVPDREARHRARP